MKVPAPPYTAGNADTGAARKETTMQREPGVAPWRSFEGAGWQREIDVRGFIAANIAPYDGGPDFLVGPSAKTTAVWTALQPYFREEVRKGVLDVDAHTPSSLTSHGPGYIDREHEVIVGLQTDRPFRRAIIPAGGWRMVESG